MKQPFYELTNPNFTVALRTKHAESLESQFLYESQSLRDELMADPEYVEEALLMIEPEYYTKVSRGAVRLCDPTLKVQKQGKMTIGEAVWDWLHLYLYAQAVKITANSETFSFQAEDIIREFTPKPE